MSRTQPVQTGSRQTGSPRTAEGGEVLLEASDLARHFDVSKPWLNRVLERADKLTLKAVDGVSFTIRRGETLALVGESGRGSGHRARRSAAPPWICRSRIPPPGRGSRRGGW